jgi:hypothetical protein
VCAKREVLKVKEREGGTISSPPLPSSAMPKEDRSDWVRLFPHHCPHGTGVVSLPLSPAQTLPVCPDQPIVSEKQVSYHHRVCLFVLSSPPACPSARSNSLPNTRLPRSSPPSKLDAHPVPRPPSHSLGWVPPFYTFSCNFPCFLCFLCFLGLPRLPRLPLLTTPPPHPASLFPVFPRPPRSQSMPSLATCQPM